VRSRWIARWRSVSAATRSRSMRAAGSMVVMALSVQAPLAAQPCGYPANSAPTWRQGFAKRRVA
jgi:hypothetical protein